MLSETTENQDNNVYLSTHKKEEEVERLSVKSKCEVAQCLETFFSVRLPLILSEPL